MVVLGVDTPAEIHTVSPNQKSFCISRRSRVLRSDREHHRAPPCITVHCRAFRRPRHRNAICYLIVLFYIDVAIFQGKKLPF